MQKTAITTRQIFFLVAPLLIIMGHFNLVSVYLGWAGKDAWIGIIIAFLLGFLIFIAMGNLNEKLYGETLIERVINRFGLWFGRFIAIPLILYFFFLSVITLYGFSDFIQSIFLNDTPLWAIALSFALVVFYMVHMGIEVIARVTEWVMIFNIATGIFVSLALMGKKDYTKLLPILENGIDPIIPVILLVLAVFGEMIVMLMINVKRGEKSLSHVKIYIILYAILLIIFPSTSAGPVAIFGEEQAKHLLYPVESTVRLVSIGLIERFDIYGLSIMTLSAMLRLALLHYATSLAVSQWLLLKNYQWLNWIIGAGLFIASLTLFDNQIHYYDMLKSYYPYGIISSVVIIMIWIFISISSRLKKKLQNN